MMTRKAGSNAGFSLLDRISAEVYALPLRKLDQLFQRCLLDFSCLNESCSKAPAEEAPITVLKQIFSKLFNIYHHGTHPRISQTGTSAGSVDTSRDPPR